MLIIRRSVAIVLMAASVAAGCSSSNDTAVAPDPSIDRSTEVPSSAAPPNTPVEDSVPVATASADTLATVPEAGVPGLDSADPFCRAWSRFAGSFQALALASNLGSDPRAALRLEVAASGAVTRAAADLAASLPPEVAGEREVFLDELLGPFTTRATEARDALLGAGLTPEAVDELGDLWLAAAADGAGDPDLVLVVPSDFQPAFDDAVADFSVPSIAADQSLVTDAAAPMTIAYIGANCPDQGILGGNDIIDE
jgi:hypothetical protein